jgi:hypothetical protein
MSLNSGSRFRDMISAAVVKQDTPTAHDDIDLVLHVGRLAVWRHRQGKQRPERAALHHGEEV